jgi:predicted nucleic acid-binding Zn finger protein
MYISMQRIEFANKSTSKNQKTGPALVEDRREDKERIAALISSRRMYRLEGSNVFFIESSKPSITYYCRYIFGSKGNSFCSCKSFEFRGHQRDCIHLEMIPIGIMKGKIIDVHALPKELKRDNTVKLQYEKEEYSY